MLTKRKLAETIITQKMGGNPSITSPIDERDVFAMADMVCSELIVQDIKNQLRGKGDYEIDSSWVRQYTDAVIQWDTTLEQCYVDLPATRINIEGDVDIQFVGWVASNTKWPQQQQGSQDAFDQLEAGYTGTNSYAYYPVHNSIYFATMPKRMTGKKVKVRMVAGIDGYGPDDVLPVPSGFAAVLMERLANMFQVQISTKSKNNNDGNPNVRT